LTFFPSILGNFFYLQVTPKLAVKLASKKMVIDLKYFSHNKLVEVVFCFLILLNGRFALCQDAQTDSLEFLLKTALSDTTRMRVNRELYLLKNDTSYVKQNLRLSKRLKFQEGIALSYRDLGRYYFFSEQQDVALKYLHRAARIAENNHKESILISTYRYIGYVYKLNDPLSAKEYYEKSLALSKRLKDEISESYALSAIGTVYEGMRYSKRHFELALNYYRKSLAIRERIGSAKEVASSLNEISRVYDLLGRYEQAVKLKFRGLEIAEKSKDTGNIIYLSSSIGNDYCRRLKDYRKALTYELRAYKLCTLKRESSDKMFEITRMVALSYSKLGDPVKADKFYQESMVYNDRMRSKINHYDYKLSSIKHDLENELAKQKLLVKDAEISEQKSEMSRQTFIRNTILAGCILLLLLLIYILKSYRQKQRINSELDQYNRKIEAFSTLMEKKNRKLKKVLIDKEVLFKEVHHRVKNNLQIVSSLLNLQSNTITDQTTKDAIKQSQSRISSMAILHNKLYQTEDFTNVSIDQYLRQMLQSITESFGTEQCLVHFDVVADPSITFSVDTAIPFGLILNELITNAFKHAFAARLEGTITIRLSKSSADQYVLLFSDNGKGLPPNFRENSENSLGLELIEMLVQQLNGTLEIKDYEGAQFVISFEESTSKKEV
jgi:two-component system, sensor histidine kinase PdtaS